MKDPASGAVTAIEAALNLAGDVKATKLKLTWLADVPQLVPLTLTDFDYLITKKKVGGSLSVWLCSRAELSTVSSRPPILLLH
jgi:hypothetical protein